MMQNALSQYLMNLNYQELILIGPFYQGPPIDSDHAIFVDAGAQFRKSNRGFSVGDGDSFDGPLDEKLSQIKDFSDLAYVFKCLPEKIRHVTLQCNQPVFVFKNA